MSASLSVHNISPFCTKPDHHIWLYGTWPFLAQINMWNFDVYRTVKSISRYFSENEILRMKNKKQN